MTLISIKEAVAAARGRKKGGGLSEWQLLELIRHNVVPPGVYVRLGRRIYLVEGEWRAFLKNGGGTYHGRTQGAAS